jgi:hypothetical protein
MRALYLFKGSPARLESLGISVISKHYHFLRGRWRGESGNYQNIQYWHTPLFIIMPTRLAEKLGWFIVNMFE